MQPLAFIGGAITGMAGLAAAAFIDHKITEARLSPDCKQAEALDSGQVVKELNGYFFKAQRLYSDCNKIALESNNLILTSATMPWDNFFRKSVSSLGGKMAQVSRKCGIEELRECGKKAQKLYSHYSPVFERAAAILSERGRTVPVVASRLGIGRIGPLDNSISNDNWDMEFDQYVDMIRNSIEQSCNMAEQLIEMLEQDVPAAALEAYHA